MADTLKDFLISIGFDVDSASQLQAETAYKKTETKLTDAAKEGLARRREAEEAAAAKRIEQAIKTGDELTTQEKSLADQLIAREKKARDDREKLKAEEEKKDKERRERQIKGFQTFAVQAAAFAVKAVAAVEATAAGVVYAVDRAAQSFERLNYMGQRSGATPRGSRAFAYASAQLGSSTEAANAALGAFGERLQTYPGYQSSLQNLIGPVRGADGKMLDSAELAARLGEKLADIRRRGGAGGLAMARAQAHAFGIDDLQQVLAMMDPRFRQLMTEQGGRGGSDNSAATHGTAFEQSMRRLEAVLDSIKTKVVDTLFVKLKPLLDDMAKWFDEHGDQIVKVIGDIVDKLTEFAKLLGPGGLIAAVALFGTTLAIKVLAPLASIVRLLGSLSVLSLPPWLLAMLGLGATAVGGAAAFESARTARGMDPIDQGDSEGAHRGWGEAWGAIKSAWGHRPKWLGGQGASGGGSGRVRPGQPGVPYNATSLTEGVGASQAQYDAFREGVTDIEGKSYGRMGGAGGRYAGRYQMGPSEITETARRLGVPRPSTEEFLANPQMQEKFFENYTLDHHNFLMRYSDKYRNMSPEKRLEILGYAHNQGAGGALTYLRTGRPGSDGWGTSGTAYFGPIRRRLGAIPAPNENTPVSPYGALDLNAFKTSSPLGVTPSVQSSISNSRGDTNITHNPTFNINGGTIDTSMSAARIAASRGNQDLLRNVQGVEQ